MIPTQVAVNSFSPEKWKILYNLCISLQAKFAGLKFVCSSMANSFDFSLSSLYMIAYISAPLLILIAYKLLTKLTSTGNDCLNLPPGSYGWPILGETLIFLRESIAGNPGSFVRKRKEKYESDVFKTSLLGEKVAVLCDGPAGNKFLFSNENKLVKIWWPLSVKKLLGECLSTTFGIEGMPMRKMIIGFLGPDAFTKLYIKTMDLVAQQHISMHWQGKEEVKVFPAMKLYTFEIACRLFMSMDEPAQIEKLATHFNIFLKGVISIAFNIPGTRFFKANRAAMAIRKELQKIVSKRKLDLQQKTASSSQDLLSHLLVNPDENGKFMAEPVIINNILMLLFAGHDTSSSTITMLIRYLAQLQKMKYSWNVVSEALRLSSPITGAFREAVVNLKYGGYDIPKGWKIYWNAPLTHTDPKLFPENSNFDPSRFEGSGPVPYSFIPFGGGPRMCIGKEFAKVEILIFLHNLITRFRWDLVDPCEKIIYDPMATPVNGLLIHLHPHHQLA